MYSWIGMLLFILLGRMLPRVFRDPQIKRDGTQICSLFVLVGIVASNCFLSSDKVIGSIMFPSCFLLSLFWGRRKCRDGDK